MPPHDVSLPPPVLAPLHTFVVPAFKTLAPFATASRRLRGALRPPVVGLFALFALSAFCLLHQHLNDRAPAFVRHPLAPRPPPRRTKLAPRPQIPLAPAQELAAVLAFVAALPTNALPDAVDPARPIDPDLVLDFDTRSPRAAREVEHLVGDTWARLPVVLLSKRHSPAARQIKSLLAEYSLDPSPAVFDLDERADAPVLTPLLFRLTAADDLPILLVAGQPIAPLARVRELHASGELRSLIAKSTAAIDGAKARKQKKNRRSAPPS